MAKTKEEILATPDKTAEQIMAESEERQRQAAAQAAAQPVQPAEQPHPQAQPTPKSTVPTFESEADLDRYWTEKQLEEAKQEKEREEARLRMQASLRSLSDLGAIFTDMIKGSEGAVVSPRSVEEHYNRLDDRQKQLVDTYRARTDLLRKQQQERAMQRAQQQRVAQQHADDLAWQERQAEKKQQAAEAEAQRQRDWQAEQYRKQNESYERRARIQADARNKAYTLRLGNETLNFNEAEGRPVYGQVFSYLLDHGYIPNDAMPKDSKTGKVIMPTAEQIRNLVDTYLPSISWQDRNMIRYLVTGERKDTRAPQDRTIPTANNNLVSQSAQNADPKDLVGAAANKNNTNKAPWL